MSDAHRPLDDKPWILAGTYAQAVEFAKSQGLDDWFYLARADRLLGVKAPTVYDVGTAYQRDDYPLICNEITIRGGCIK